MSADRAVVRLLRVVALVVLAVATLSAADKQFTVRGMVVKVDAAARSVVVSHETIAGFMDAMTMPFEVRQPADLNGLVPGAVVEFTLVVGDTGCVCVERHSRAALPERRSRIRRPRAACR